MTQRAPPYSSEVRARAVRMVLDHQGAQASQRAAIAARNTLRCATPSGSPRPGSSRPSAALILSLSKDGDSYDNALAETINSLFKAEVIHRRVPWQSFEAIAFATLEWIDWFNTRRLLESIGNIPPAEAEARYYAQTEVQTSAAGPNQTKWPPGNPARFRHEVSRNSHSDE